MIYCSKCDLPRYKGISPDLDKAIDHCMKLDPAGLSLGRNEVDGDRIFINRFDYVTAPSEEILFEAHLDYADLHVVVFGEEIIELADTADLTETVRDLSQDYIGLTGEKEFFVPMTEDKILIVFPEDGHKVRVQLNGPVKTGKAVYKIKV